MKISAIILAAGNGRRMNSKTRKQFMEVLGKPLVWYSLNAFQNSRIDEIILVASEEDLEYCKNDIVKKYNMDKVVRIVAGGKERYNSVYNGLLNVTGEYVLVHDGARPLINNELIERCINGALKYEATVAGVPVKDTIKIVNKDNIIESTPDRDTLWVIQTPQAFKYKILKEAYNKMMEDCGTGVTDDAMVVEKYTDTKVRLVNGFYENIKVTTLDDIAVAESLLKS